MSCKAWRGPGTKGAARNAPSDFNLVAGLKVAQILVDGEAEILATRAGAADVGLRFTRRHARGVVAVERASRPRARRREVALARARWPLGP